MIDIKTVKHVAQLARLHITDEEAREYAEQLAKALEHFQQISEIDTAGVEPLVTPVEIDAYWREDQVENEFTVEEMTSGAPAKIGNLFKVPPVV